MMGTHPRRSRGRSTRAAPRLRAAENASEGVSDTVTVKHDIYNKVWGKVSHHITLMLRRPRRGAGAAERGCGEGQQAGEEPALPALNPR